MNEQQNCHNNVGCLNQFTCSQTTAQNHRIHFSSRLCFRSSFSLINNNKFLVIFIIANQQ